MTELLKWCGAQMPDAPLLPQADHDGFYSSLLTQSITVDRESSDGIVCTLRVPPCLCNADGKLHGGAITSLVDIVGSAPLISVGLPHSGVSVDMNVTFVAAASLGDEIEIEAKALHIGKSSAMIAVDMRFKATGKLVAQGRHTKFLQILSTRMDGGSKL